MTTELGHNALDTALHTIRQVVPDHTTSSQSEAHASRRQWSSDENPAEQDRCHAIHYQHTITTCITVNILKVLEFILELRKPAEYH